MAAQLDGKVALVTGGASGIGRATALAFMREGARLMIADTNEGGGRQTVDLVVKGGGKALFTKADVTQGPVVQALVAKTVEAYGRLEKEIGTLEAGKKADIILVDVMTPWCNPIYRENLITNLVFNANGSDVTDVFVDGRAIVKDGEMTTVDRVAVLKETQRRAERIWAIASKTWG